MKTENYPMALTTWRSLVNLIVQVKYEGINLVKVSLGGHGEHEHGKIIRGALTQREAKK